MKPFIKIFTVLLLFTAMLVGCSLKDTDTSSQSLSTQSEQNKLNVVTSFYPIYILTSNVVKEVDSVNLVNLTKPQTGCLHDYQLTTGDMKKLDSADLFIINGLGMESFLDKAIEEYPELNVVNTSNALKVIQLTQEQYYKDDINNLSQYNPHIWLSVFNAKRQVKNIETALAKADPSNADQYEKNANAYIEKLTKLEKEMSALDLQNMNIGVFHEGFDYFADKLNMNVQVAVYAEENEKPSAKELSVVIDNIKDKNVTVLFASDDSGKKIAETIGKQTDTSVLILDPITSGEMEPDAYINAMQKNIDVLKTLSTQKEDSAQR